MSIIQNRVSPDGDDNLIGLILLGAAGCGKGTQMKLLLDREGYEGVHIDLGEEIRYKLKNDDFFMKKHCALVRGGKLLPDQVALQIVQEKARQIRQRGIIGLDGFCRNRCQADMVGHIFSRPYNLLAVEFEIDLDAAVERLSNGRKRDDDDKAAERHKLWTDNRKHVRRKLESKGIKVIPMNANGTPEFVFDEFHGYVRDHVRHLKALSAQKHAGEHHQHDRRDRSSVGHR